MNNVKPEGAWDWTKKRYVPATIRQVERYSLQFGDVLFNATNSAEQVGKSALYSDHVEEVVCFSNHFLRLRVDSERLLPEYLVRFLGWLWGRRVFENMVNAWVNQATVRREDLVELRIPLPPLAEQRRITAILDKVDTIRRKRQQAIQLADDFLRAVFMDMFGDPVTNPKGWMVKKIKELCMVRGGKRIPKGDSLVKEDTGFPYIKAGNIKSGQVTTKNLEYVPPHVRKVIERYTVDEGDICITVVGANIGDVGIVPKELHKASLTENANKIIIRDGAVLSSWYLSFFLQTDFVQSQIKSKTMAVGVPKLAIFRIEELDFILPPKELQDKFSHIVSAIYGLRESLQSSNSLSQLEFQCLNQKAFRGEL
ncbi:restriction endonuclease subunit S [Pseudomonas sp. MBLB4123]|uniref:restriction endonuclease subunit S n=1 Tax=Pseudomonas sp. MBLB4123 TaxID=3451557 RepID=UPI003F74FE4D